MTDEENAFGEMPLLIRFSKRQTGDEVRKVNEYTRMTPYEYITKEGLEALGCGEVIELVVQGRKLV